MRRYDTTLAMRAKAKESALKIVEQIKQHPETRLLVRGEIPHAWQYVEESFPSVANRVKATVVYKNDNTAFCKKVGIPQGAGGLFFIPASTLLVCHNPVFGDDVVVVHEMLHYVSQLLGGSMRNERLEEDFAYSKSIRYLLSRGYTEDWIVEKYLLPYYHGYEVHQLRSSRARPLASEMAAAKEAAIARCRRIVAAETGQAPEPPPKTRTSRFDF